MPTLASLQHFSFRCTPVPTSDIPPFPPLAPSPCPPWLPPIAHLGFTLIIPLLTYPLPKSPLDTSFVPLCSPWLPPQGFHLMGLASPLLILPCFGIPLVKSPLHSILLFASPLCSLLCTPMPTFASSLKFWRKWAWALKCATYSPTDWWPEVKNWKKNCSPHLNQKFYDVNTDHSSPLPLTSLLVNFWLTPPSQKASFMGGP